MLGSAVITAVPSSSSMNSAVPMIAGTVRVWRSAMHADRAVKTAPTQAAGYP